MLFCTIDAVVVSVVSEPINMLVLNLLHRSWGMLFLLFLTGKYVLLPQLRFNEQCFSMIDHPIDFHIIRIVRISLTLNEILMYWLEVQRVQLLVWHKGVFGSKFERH